MSGGPGASGPSPARDRGEFDWGPSERLERLFVTAGSGRAVASLDDLPLWSAAFGLALLDRVPLAHGLRVLDLGCGTGFPLLEVAERLGGTSTVVGLDPWVAALARARDKAGVRGVANAHLVSCPAEAMPFPAESFDLVVANNGLNNVADPARSLAECRRVTRAGGRLVMTANLPGTFATFYGCLDRLLDEQGLAASRVRLVEHIRAKRPDEPAWHTRLAEAGFEVASSHTAAFDWPFVDGRAFLGHWLIRLAFLPPWRALLPEHLAGELMAELERRLDGDAATHGGLHLEVPFVVIEATAAGPAAASGGGRTAAPPAT